MKLGIYRERENKYWTGPYKELELMEKVHVDKNDYIIEFSRI